MLGGICILSLVILGIFVPEKLDQTQKELVYQKKEHTKTIDLLQSILPQISNINEDVEELKADTLNLLKAGNLITSNPDVGIGGTATDISDTSEVKVNHFSEIEQLNKTRQDLYDTRSNINGLNEYLVQLKRFLEVTPSIHPLLGKGFIISGFGPRRDPFLQTIRIHQGIDIADIPGTPVRATANGEVTYANWGGGAGLYIEVKHRFGFSSKYMHLSSIDVEKGQKVKKGQIIGRLGSTGRSTGPHLHYEVRVNDIPQDPAPWVNLDKTW